MLASFRFSWEAPVWSLPHTNKRTSGREEEHKFVPIGIPTVCWRTRPPKITNMLSIKNSSLLMISVSVSFLVESVFDFFSQNKIYPFLTQGICIYVGHSFFYYLHDTTYNMYNIKEGGLNHYLNIRKCTRPSYDDIHVIME